MSVRVMVVVQDDSQSTSEWRIIDCATIASFDDPSRAYDLRKAIVAKSRDALREQVFSGRFDVPTVQVEC